MNLWMFSLGYAGGLAVCSLWAGEWARRKGLNAKAWNAIGMTAGPLGVLAVGLHKAEASLCPHCKTPMRFEERYCATCRAIEVQQAEMQDIRTGEADFAENNVLVHHGFFEKPQAQAVFQSVHAH